MRPWTHLATAELAEGARWGEDMPWMDLVSTVETPVPSIGRPCYLVSRVNRRSYVPTALGAGVRVRTITVSAHSIPPA